jgi:Zn-dependent protease
VSNRYDPGDLEPLSAPEPRTLPSEHDRSRRSLLGRIVAPVAVAIGALVKFGAFGLKFFGIFLAVGGYALIWGWKFGVGVVLLILVHELGHYVEAKRLGLDPQLPVFIPFLGAYVALRNMRFDPWVNARVSLAGPVAGGIAALACLIVGVQTGSDLLRALAYMGFLLNLFNLIPVWLLDGSRGFLALSRVERWIVVATIAVALYLTGQRLLFIVGGVAVWRAAQREVGPGDRRVLATFVILVAALSWIAKAVG